MFKSLYRKYRPKKFIDVVGQENVVKVLKNEIDQKKIAHAYIFYGPRGTGKTSLAKIFSNEVNNNKEYLQESVDIIEIDAASNNGVDEIRDLKENIKFSPTESKYKVYIIDEVHMLTNSAFNALLKTLEEPPSHVIFILATTEIYKIPKTIISRCQRFEFKNLTEKEIVSRISYIANEENIKIDIKALEKIAQASKGGLRDAIGLLEQASNLTDDKISLEDILEITSSISEEDIVNFYELILNNNTSKALEEYEKFLESSKDTDNIIVELISLSKDIIVYKNTLNENFCNYKVSKLENILKTIPIHTIYDNVDELSKTQTNIRFSKEEISYMQICIIKMCSNCKEKSEANKETEIVKKLEEKIKKLEDKVEKLEEDYNNKIKESKVASINNKNLDILDTNSKITNYIIPDKEEIISIIENSSEVLTNYANNVLSKIVKESTKINNEFKNIFLNSKIYKSSKNGGIIIFDDVQNIFKINSNIQYKDIIQEELCKILEVEYNIFILQREQYNYLLENIKNNLINDNNLKNSKKENNKVTDIEKLFSEIIVEK